MRNGTRELARKLREARLARRWSLREAASQMGITHAMLSRIEQGHDPPGSKSLRGIAAAFPELRGDVYLYITESPNTVAVLHNGH